MEEHTPADTGPFSHKYGTVSRLDVNAGQGGLLAAVFFFFFFFLSFPFFSFCASPESKG